MYHPSQPLPKALKINARCHQIYSLGPSHTDNTGPADCHIAWLNLLVPYILICNDGSPVPLEGDQLMPVNFGMYADPIATSLTDSQNLPHLPYHHPCQCTRYASGWLLPSMGISSHMPVHHPSQLAIFCMLLTPHICHLLQMALQPMLYTLKSPCPTQLVV